MRRALAPQQAPGTADGRSPGSAQTPSWQLPPFLARPAIVAGGQTESTSGTSPARVMEGTRVVPVGSARTSRSS
eukprot:4831129-Prymnesium_polylepis.1